MPVSILTRLTRLKTKPKWRNISPLHPSCNFTNKATWYFSEVEMHTWKIEMNHHSIYHCSRRHWHCWSKQYAGLVSHKNSVKSLRSPWVLEAKWIGRRPVFGRSWIRFPSGSDFFLCPKLLSLLSFHLYHKICHFGHSVAKVKLFCLTISFR